MNRIRLDDSIIIKKIEDSKLIVNIDSSMNIIIDDIKYDNHIFNIGNCEVNILCNFNNIKKCIYFEFNICGGRLVFNNISNNCCNQNEVFNLKDVSSKVKVINSYLSYNEENISVSVFHENKKTISEIYNCAVTSGNGSVKFDLKTKVDKGMKDSIVSQNGRIITLNKNNKNQINPVLLIDEIDCIANHSAFIGEFKNEELFYMLSRGIERKKAINLLIYGFLIGIMEISLKEKEELKKIL